MAAFNSSILLLNNDTDTGLPPKLPPEPNIKRSVPITGPTSSLNRLATSDEFISSGRSSPGNILIASRALDELLILLIVFSNNTLSVPFRYFSVNSLFTISALSSIIEMIESVTFTLVPLGIPNSIVTVSLAILGNIVTPTTPPPIKPKVITKRKTNIPNDSTLNLNTKSKIGA